MWQLIKQYGKVIWEFCLVLLCFLQQNGKRGRFFQDINTANIGRLQHCGCSEKFFKSMWEWERYVHICEWNTAQQDYLRTWQIWVLKQQTVNMEQLSFNEISFKKDRKCANFKPFSLYVLAGKDWERGGKTMTSWHRNISLSSVHWDFFMKI